MSGQSGMVKILSFKVVQGSSSKVRRIQTILETRIHAPVIF